MDFYSLVRNEDIVRSSFSNLPEIKIKGIALHSKKVDKDFLFFALSSSHLSFENCKEQFKKNIIESIRYGARVVIFDFSFEKISSLLREEDLLSKNEIHFVQVKNARCSLAYATHNFYPQIPKNIVAVTGTSGKSSVVSFLRQIWKKMGVKSASIGTLGIEYDNGSIYTGLTTPDVISLYQSLEKLEKLGVTHVAIEASSHGIEQYRLDNLPLKAAAFTNLGHDHLDYHETIDHYFNAKKRLFQDLLEKEAPAIIFADDPYGQNLIDFLSKRSQNLWTVGYTGDFIKIKSIENREARQILKFSIKNQNYQINFPLLGTFQVINALLAVAFAVATNIEESKAVCLMEALEPVCGRLEFVGETKNQIRFYIDYAHKPEALKAVLQSMRLFTKGRILLVFGCGGNRDREKRPLMGEIAQNLADITIVSDDNPRFEKAENIRAEILKKAPSAFEEGNRRAAIYKAFDMAKPGDNILIAGKGHERGQIVEDKIIPFSDHDVVYQLLKDLKQ